MLYNKQGDGKVTFEGFQDAVVQGYYTELTNDRSNNTQPFSDELYPKIKEMVFEYLCNNDMVNIDEIQRKI